MIDNNMTKTRASVRVLRQRAGGWCEPVQERIFPLSESVMKVTGSYPVSYVREVMPDHSAWQDGWQRGRICLSSQCFVHMGGQGDTGREAFLCTRGGRHMVLSQSAPAKKAGKICRPCLITGLCRGYCHGSSERAARPAGKIALPDREDSRRSLTPAVCPQRRYIIESGFNNQRTGRKTK